MRTTKALTFRLVTANFSSCPLEPNKTYLSPVSNTAPFTGLEVRAYLVLQHLLKLGIRHFLILP